MANPVTETYGYYPFTTTANVFGRAGQMAGITIVTAGNLTVYDDAGTGTTRLVLAITAVTAGQYVALPCGLGFGCYIVTTATGTAWIV